VSQSPLQDVQTSYLPDTFQQTLSRLNRLISSGMSFSGHEPNCAFLNPGRSNLNPGRGVAFANISAAAGFDFLDDGRGLAVVDWDQDGDLDVWTANRTAPRLRFLRNNTTRKNHFLAIRLVGDGATTNRDAIGARVEITVRGSQFSVLGSRTLPSATQDNRELRTENREPKLVKSLRAGEGFLSQSTKWIHFGLGDATQIERVVVHWPGGEPEGFTQLNVDRWHHLVQHTGQAQSWTPPKRTVSLRAAATEMPVPTGAGRVLLSAQLPLPPLEYETWEGERFSLDEFRGSPLLLNLWASWCRPCLTELAEFKAHERELRDAGLRLLALSVDALEPTGSGKQAAESLATERGIPFAAGYATAELVDKLQAVHDFLFARHRSLPVPTSILIDSAGQMAAIYRGAVAVETVLADVDRLALHGGALLEASLPFSGHWFAPPTRRRLTFLASQLAEQGYVEDALHYVSQHRTDIDDDPESSKLRLLLGSKLLDRGQLVSAEAQFRTVEERQPENSAARFMLGVALASQDKFAEAIEHFRQVLKDSPQHARAHNNLGAALEKMNKLGEAIVHYRQAVQIDPAYARPHLNLARAFESQGSLEDAIGHYRHLIRIQADDATAHRELGKALAAAGQLDDGVLHLREAIQLNPELAPPHNDLGNVLQTLGELEEAKSSYQRAVELDPDYADALNNVGTVLQMQGELEEAVDSYRRALEKQPNHPDAHLNLGKLRLSQGQPVEAQYHLRAVLRRRPDDAQAHGFLGLILSKSGEVSAAIGHLRKSLQLRSDDLMALNGLAWILATTPDTNERDATKAVALAERAASLTQRKHPAILDTLAASYAAVGDFDRAVATAQLALQLFTDSQAEQLARETRERLRLYQTQQPYQESENSP